MKLSKFLLSFAAIACSSAALAAGTGRADVSWTAPTTDVNGATLVNPLTAFTVYRGTKADGSDLVKLATTAGTAAAYADSALPFGTWCYAVTASNAAGESDKSAVACKTITEARPAATIIVTVH
jgi:hypothetical protein